MTTKRTTRRSGQRASSPSDGKSRSALGESLRLARERKGVDLFRVERDIKIRARYLAALEDGEYSELPGDVYARGFLRNYASYLGMDPDEVVDEWRAEAGQQPGGPPTLSAPRPLVVARHGFVLQNSHFAILGVILVVILVGVYFSFQVSRFLSYPTLAVTQPGSATFTAPTGTTSYPMEGTATPGSTVQISWDGQDPKTELTDDIGHWTYQAQLHPGSNQFDITAMNLDTNHASPKVTRVIVVPVATPTPAYPEVAFATPVDGSVLKDGSLIVTGTSVEVSNVTMTATYLGGPPLPGTTMAPYTPPPSGQPTPTPLPSSPIPLPTAPPPANATTSADGSFSMDMQLSPGAWLLTLTGTDASGRVSKPATRSVAVPYVGLTIVLSVRGGDAWMRYIVDGYPTGQSTYPDGWQTVIQARKSFCVLVTTVPGRVFVTANGVDLGSVAAYGGVRLYVDTTKGPRNVASCPQT